MGNPIGAFLFVMNCSGDIEEVNGIVPGTSEIIENNEDPNVDLYHSYGINFANAMNDFINRLNDIESTNPDEVEIQTLLYDIGKMYYGKENLRTFFMHMYQMLYERDSGSRFGTVIEILGIRSFISLMKNRMSDPLSLGFN